MDVKSAKILTTVFGVGYLPKAPGTWGSLAGIGLYCLMRLLFSDIPQIYRDCLLISMIIVVTATGVRATKTLMPLWGHDPGKIVLDEVVGIWIVLLFVPYTLINMILAFLLFRFFDIIKPLGIGIIDKKWHSPLSVFLDDILAGIYAWIVMQGFLLLL